jgi:hypothetical protein
MSRIHDIFSSRNGSPNLTLNTHIGSKGRLFYDEATGELRISDGVTPGGSPIPITIATSATAGAVRPGAGFTITTGGVLSLNAGPSFYLDEEDVFRLRPGSADLIGGIKAGPGVVIDSEGTLFIDSEGLEFSFGDFSATVGEYTDETEYALLSSIKEDEDIVIASNGDGGVKVVGMFEIFATNGTVTGSLEDEEPFFRVLEDGQVRILVPLADTTEGGVEIIGSLSGTSLQPGIAGTMLHLTGNADLPTRVYHDSLGEYSSYVFRRYNGSVITPTQVLADEAVGRINFTAATDAGMGNVAFAQIRINAIEDQTTTAQGSEMLFFVTAEGDTASNRKNVLSIKGTGIELPVAGTTLKLSGSTSGTITLQATATAGTNTITLPATTGTVVTTGDTGTVTNTMLAGSIANDKLANSTISGVALGGTLAALSAGNYLTGSDYTGATVRTFAVDATTTATASKVVARDVNGDTFANQVNDSKGDVRSVPINGRSGAYNLAATDNGKMISITTGGVSVLQNVFADPYGQIVSIYNDSNSSQTITQGTGVTLRLAGTAATGNRTLARYGVATITCVAANTFVISGAGIT